MTRPLTRSYHHGDLPGVLRATTAELIAERGAVGFSLREVARRAGVSHAAPTHHFGDSTGLLTSVATEAYRLLCEAFSPLAEIGDPVERLRRLGEIYVAFAEENPGHFALMCNKDQVDVLNEDFVHWAAASYIALLDTLDQIRQHSNPNLDVELAATMLWSTAHGLATVSRNLEDVAANTDTTTAPPKELIRKFVDLVMTGLAERP